MSDTPCICSRTPPSRARHRAEGRPRPASSSALGVASGPADAAQTQRKRNSRRKDARVQGLACLPRATTPGPRLSYAETVSSLRPSRLSPHHAQPSFTIQSATSSQRPPQHGFAGALAAAIKATGRHRRSPRVINSRSKHVNDT